MKKNMLLAAMLWLVAFGVNAQGFYVPHSQITPKPTTDVAVETGPYHTTDLSLSSWQCPEWYRDVKFGIWAHWGPQCQAEYGDWYARGMYIPGDRAYNWHVSHYGDPSVYGFKEMCRDFTVPDWNPEDLMKKFYDAGARYFVQLGNHHDNFDLWDSPYQEWNCMNMGPGRDIVGGWMEACKKYGMRYGISFHAAHCWDFMDYSQDFDGNWTVADGAGKWWEGYDPQELYAQQHGRDGNIHWYWDGPYKPEMPYMQKFQNRILQCVSKYSPDLIYFDDTVLPFWQYKPEIGRNILTHYYNLSAAKNGGQQQVVVTGKILEDSHKQFMLWDVERGIPDRCQDLPWQTCTCIGNWHYDWFIFENNQYKSAGTVIRMLVDIVSKNGNLLLSIPMNRVGGIDWREENILNEVAAWMKINSESIYETRPWKVFGEGPLFDSVNPLNQQGFNEGVDYSNRDVRYVQKGNTVYATIMRWPSAGTFTFTSLSIVSPYYCAPIQSVRLLGYGDVSYTLDDNGLNVTVPSTHPNDIAPVFAITVNTDAAAQYDYLQQLIQQIENNLATYSTRSGYNTGKYSPYALEKLQEELTVAQAVTSTQSDADIANAVTRLHIAYRDFLTAGRAPGGNLSVTGTDLTTEQLVEASGFTRSDGRTTRFGTPKYWTVENFTINNPNGTKNGIDNYPGFNSLMLGVWSGEDQGTSSDLTNARIYRKVHLDAGRYYFGAKICSLYQLTSQAYIFAASATCPTSQLPAQSIAYYPINQCREGDGYFYGIEFTLEEAQDVLLGFQADLTNGSSTQEFRVEAVRLLRLGNTTRAALTNLINTVTTAYERAESRANDNTGFYSRAALARLQSYIDQANALPEDATSPQIISAYNLLNDAYQDFLVNGLNPGGLPDLLTSHTDLTLDLLIEADHFSRTPETDNGTRFGTPLYWSVGNYNIPHGNDGTKHGLDLSDGQDELMLGVWNDRGSNNSGQLTNARIYRQVHLDAGRYYFGAQFESIKDLNRAYIFASDRLNSTSTIASRSIAYYDINSCATDGQFYGIFFTLEEEQDVFLGFQANLKDGSATQEFRATAVKLLKYDTPEPDAIEEIQHSTYNAQLSTIYDLSGRRVTTPTRGFYIINGRKVFIK